MVGHTKAALGRIGIGALALGLLPLLVGCTVARDPGEDTNIDEALRRQLVEIRVNTAIEQDFQTAASAAEVRTALENNLFSGFTSSPGRPFSPIEDPASPVRYVGPRDVFVAFAQPLPSIRLARLDSFALVGVAEPAVQHNAEWELTWGPASGSVFEVVLEFSDGVRRTLRYTNFQIRAEGSAFATAYRSGRVDLTPVIRTVTFDPAVRLELDDAGAGFSVDFTPCMELVMRGFLQDLVRRELARVLVGVQPPPPPVEEPPVVEPPVVEPPVQVPPVEEPPVEEPPVEVPPADAPAQE